MMIVVKANKQAHVPNVKRGLGDFYGQGVRNKIGRMRDDSMGQISLTPKKLKTPPKSLA